MQVEFNNSSGVIFGEGESQVSCFPICFSTLHTKGLGEFKIIVEESLARAHGFYLWLGSNPVGEVFLHGKARSIACVQDTGKFGEREAS